LASHYGQTVEKIENVTINSTNLTGLGNEPKVLTAALRGAVNAIGEPIIGNSGVFFLMPSSKTDGAATATNVPSLRNTSNSQDRARVTGGLLNALKKTVKIQDSRLALDI